MGVALKIRDDLTPTALRARALRGSNWRAAARMYAIANALEGMTRAQAARLRLGLTGSVIGSRTVNGRFQAEAEGRGRATLVRFVPCVDGSVLARVF